MNPFEFKPEHKQIYEYINFEGQKAFADPLLIVDLIEFFSKGKFNEFLDIWQSPASDAQAKINAEENVCNVAANAFQIKRFDPKTGQGATKSYLLDLISHFLDWQEEVKKKPEESRI